MAKQQKENESSQSVESNEPYTAYFSSQGARDYQEDKAGSFINAKNGHFFAVVADGAGGHGGGAEAAAAAVGTAARMWEASGGEIRDGGDFLKEFMISAHEEVRAEAKRITRSARAAVVAVASDGEQVHWVHAGDCRLYRMKGREILERTRDDSVVQILFESGEITEEEMGDHPDQNRLLQSLGSDEPPTLRYGFAGLDIREVFLLCSDGLWENQSKDEIIGLANTPREHCDAAVEKAVNEAVQRAGKKADNTTALVVSLGPVSGARAREEGRGTLDPVA